MVRKVFEGLLVIVIMVTGIVVGSVVMAKRVISAKEAQLWIGRGNVIPDQAFLQVECSTPDTCRLVRVYTMDSEGEFDYEIGSGITVDVRFTQEQ